MVAGVIRVRSQPEDVAIRQAMHKERELHARKQEHDYSHVFRPKTRFELIRVCCIIMGIEFAYAAETAFVSPTLLEIGIRHEAMTMVWCLSPILGFFLAPFMGSLSDRCKLNWGRRRPLILLLSIFSFIGLILIPWGKNIGRFFGDNVVTTEAMVVTIANESLHQLHSSSNDTIGPEVVQHSSVSFHRWSVVVTIIGVIFLDFSADTNQTPARTYMLDMCISEDHAHGLSIFTVLAGLGGFMGYSLCGVDWKQTFIGHLIPNNIQTVFIIVTVLFVICCVITLCSFREIPLRLLEADEKLRPLRTTIIKCEVERNKSTCIKRDGPSYIDLDVIVQQNNRNMVDNFGKPVDTVINEDEEEGDDDEEKITLREYLMSIVQMPRSMRILCLTNLLSWMAYLSYSLYYTDFVGDVVFSGDLKADVGTVDYELYQSGLRFGSWGLAIYALSCSLYSMIIERLIKWFGARVVYVGGLVVFGLGMMVLASFPTKLGVLLLSITAGLLYSTLFTIPYLLVANYHSSGSFKVKKGQNVPLEKKRGLGTDIAVISSMMFVAQIIVSLTIGWLISWMATSAAYIYSAGFFSLCSAVMATRVLYMDL